MERHPLHGDAYQTGDATALLTSSQKPTAPAGVATAAACAGWHLSVDDPGWFANCSVPGIPRRAGKAGSRSEVNSHLHPTHLPVGSSSQQLVTQPSAVALLSRRGSMVSDPVDLSLLGDDSPTRGVDTSVHVVECSAEGGAELSESELASAAAAATAAAAAAAAAATAAYMERYDDEDIMLGLVPASNAEYASSHDWDSAIIWDVASAPLPLAAPHTQLRGSAILSLRAHSLPVPSHTLDASTLSLGIARGEEVEDENGNVHLKQKAVVAGAGAGAGPNAITVGPRSNLPFAGPMLLEPVSAARVTSSGSFPSRASAMVRASRVAGLHPEMLRLQPSLGVAASKRAGPAVGVVSRTLSSYPFFNTALLHDAWLQTAAGSPERPNSHIGVAAAAAADTSGGSISKGVSSDGAAGVSGLLPASGSGLGSNQLVTHPLGHAGLLSAARGMGHATAGGAGRLACGTAAAALLLDLNDPNMVFLSSRADVVLRCAAMVRPLQQRVKVASGGGGGGDGEDEEGGGDELDEYGEPVVAEEEEEKVDAAVDPITEELGRFNISSDKFYKQVGRGR